MKILFLLKLRTTYSIIISFKPFPWLQSVEQLFYSKNRWYAPSISLCTTPCFISCCIFSAHTP